jgi:hypothetical protein
VLGEIHQMRKELRYVLRMPRRWGGGLRRSAFARNIQGSNSIEGYVVAEDDAAAAIDDEEPFSADEKTFLEIQGYRQALGYVLAMSDADYVTFDTTELNLVTIHPFRDGNGRMARALATLVLSRSDMRRAQGPLRAKERPTQKTEHPLDASYDVIFYPAMRLARARVITVPERYPPRRPATAAADSQSHN